MNRISGFKCVTLLILLLIACRAAKGQQSRGLEIESTGNNGLDIKTTYALIVGISHYQNITSLKYADKDAALFRDYLRSSAGGNVKDENIRYLINDSAKAGTILINGLCWMKNRPYLKGDRLFIYMAGHGDAEDAELYYFLGSDFSIRKDCSKDNLRVGATVPLYLLKHDIGKITAQGVQVILIMDACRSNELLGSEAGRRMFTNGIMNTDMGEIRMLAASPGEQSVEGPDEGGGHGLFTWYLLDGLSGEAAEPGDSLIDFYHLEKYVKEKVRKEAETKFNGHKQSPEFRGYVNDRQPLARVDSTFHALWVKNRNMSRAITGDVIAANPGKREYSGGGDDTTTLRLYSDFLSAVKREQLLGDSSAAKYYRDLVLDNPNSRITEDAKYTLAGEYLNFAQGKINLYLQGKDQTSEKTFKRLVSAVPGVSADFMSETEFKYRLVATVPFSSAADMMDSAFVLLKNDSIINPELLSKYLFLRGKSYFERKSRIPYDTALAFARKGIKLQPKGAYLYELLGNLLTETGKHKSALDTFRKAIILAPAWIYPISEYANSLRVLQMYDSALIYLNMAAKIDSGRSKTWASMADVYFSKRSYSSAEKYYLKALRTDSNSVAIYTSLGLTCSKLHDLSSSERYYREALKLHPRSTNALNELGSFFSGQQRYDSAIKYFSLSAHFDSSNGETWQRLALAFYSDRRYALAIAHCKMAIAVDSSELGPWMLMGMTYFDAQKYDSASLYYGKALSIDSQNAAVYFFVGFSHQLRKQYEEAEICYKKMVSLRPSDAEYRYALGVAYNKQKKYGPAIASLNEALLLDSVNGGYWSALGRIYEDRKIFDSAEYDYKRALSTDSLNAHSWYNLGSLQYEKKKFDSALSYLDMALLLDTGHRASVKLKSYAYKKMGNYDSALVYAKKLVSLDSTNYEANRNIGYVYLRLKLFDHAGRYFLRALQIDPSNVYAPYNLACAYAGKNDQVLAIKFLEQAFVTGYKDFIEVSTDTDLDNIRSLPEFTELLKKYFPDKYK